MQAVLTETGLAVVLFVATNIDDVFVLLAFFADPRTRMRDIVAGQFLGIAVLFFASLVASLLSLVFPAPYVGLLGILPILIGLVKLRASWRSSHGEPADDASEPAPGAVRIASVAAITIANGGDNIGVYVPVFATRSLSGVAVIGVVFAILTLMCCVAARWMVSHPWLGAPIRRHGNRVMPWLLIAIGLLVMWQARSFALLPTAGAAFR